MVMMMMMSDDVWYIRLDASERGEGAGQSA
jgi:hypothetical protein